MNKLISLWALRLLFYVCLDVVIGTIIYVISIGEVGLTPGQLAVRILTAMALASAIVGGPDIMLFWQELGRRIAAEEKADAAEQRADAAEEKAGAAVKESYAWRQEVDELRAMIEQMQNRRASRRSRPRRRLRNNGQ